MRVAGSYFRNDYSGFGADDASLPIADQALMALLSAQPTLTYSEWATQAQGSDTSWTEQLPTVDYQAFAVSDYQLVSVANTTSSEVQTLAVISPVLTTQSTLTTAFQGTPFSYQKTEAVYAQLDPNQPPQIYFLYWLVLRDPSDPKTGPTSLNYAATMVGGVLSYILQIPIAVTDRPRPSISFASAFGTQTAQGPLSVPQTQAQQTTIPAMPSSTSTALPASPSGAPVPLVLPPPPILPGFAPSPSMAQQASAADSSSPMGTVLLLGLGAAAAIYGYRYYQERKARA
jgi:hypothetical protein